ncbi:hypothetical protein D3C78_1135490 [compost metagenome]
MQTFIYMSNMAKAVKRSGEIWLSMAKELFVEDGRKMKTIGYQGEMSSIELRRPVMGETGPELENDFSNAKFDVAVDVGPSSSSKRAATVRALTGMMTITQDPETLQVLGAMAMMNMEGEGIEDVRAFFRKRLVNMGVVEPTEEEQQELMAQAANQQPTPQDQYFQAAAQEAAAKAAKANADTIGSIADAEKTRAETAKIITDIDATHQQQALEIIDRAVANQPSPPDVTAVVVNPQ